MGRARVTRDGGRKIRGRGIVEERVWEKACKGVKCAGKEGMMMK